MSDVEGFSLEDLAAELYEERSRKGIGSFELSGRIEGYWNSRDTQIDLVALDEPRLRIRFGFCRRSQDRLLSSLEASEAHVERFLDSFPSYRRWTLEVVGISPVLDAEARGVLARRNWLAEDLEDLARGLLDRGPDRALSRP
jgi:hypothetical protein